MVVVSDDLFLPAKDRLIEFTLERVKVVEKVFRYMDDCLVLFN